MQAFSMLDTDDTGVLSTKDITRLMNRLMGRKLDEMQIAEIMSEICNSDAPGVTIDFDTFYASLKPVFDAGEDELNAKAFAAMDLDKSGHIDAKELAPLMSHVAGQKLTQTQVDNVLSLSAADGKVKYADYVKVTKPP